jgi:hypothetical protein
MRPYLWMYLRVVYDAGTKGPTIIQRFTPMKVVLASSQTKVCFGNSGLGAVHENRIFQ